jgi:hypothetical protein
MVLENNIYKLQTLEDPGKNKPPDSRKQTVGIPMGTNCAHSLADFLYSYEAEFIQKLE